MIRVKTTLITGALLLLSSALGGHSASAQVAARPAPAPTPPEVHARVSETVVDGTIPDDPAVDKMLEVYAPKVRALEVVIGKLKGELRKSGIGSGSLGNFVTNGIRQEASLKLGKPVDLAVTNGGGLRKTVISEGDLRIRDIFELLPFEFVGSGGFTPRRAGGRAHQIPHRRQQAAGVGNGSVIGEWAGKRNRSRENLYRS